MISGESINNDDSITVVAKISNNSNVDTKADVSLFTTEVMDNKIAEKSKIALTSGENTQVTFNIKKNS